MAADEPDSEIAQLRGDIEQLRAIINRELDAGGTNRALMLACAQLLREKNDRLGELGWIE